MTTFTHNVSSYKALFILFLSTVITPCIAMEESLVDLTCREELHNLLLNNSEKISRALDERYGDFYNWNYSLIQQDSDSLSNYIDQMSQRMQLEKQQSPLLSFISECPAPCRFSRTLNPHLRKMFETRVMGLLFDALQVKRWPSVVYTSCGCNNRGLQDLIILTRFLQQHPITSLNIHMIDLLHESAILLRKNTERGSIFNSSDHCRVNPSLFDLDKYRQLVAYFFSTAEDRKDAYFVAKRTISQMFRTEMIYNTLLSWLRTQFPQACVSLWLHSNQEEYSSYLREHLLLSADVVAAIDINNEVGRLHHVVNGYGRLCLKSLVSNPTSTNLLLDENIDDKNGIVFCTMSREQTGSDQEEKVEIFSADNSRVLRTFYKQYEMVQQ